MAENKTNSPPSRKYLNVAGVAVLVLVTTVMWFVYKGRRNSAEQLLLAAYAQQRTFDLRISGAPYGAMRNKRSPHLDSRFDQPSVLLEAEARIAQELKDEPQVSSLLQLRAKADLLNWNYEDAIKILQHGLEDRPDTADAQLDLATAYFQRAEANDQPSDYGRAVELLGATLEHHPENITALFNRAVVFEKLLLYREAARDWGTYLQLDPHSSWADESRHRLDALEQRLGVRGRSGDELEVAPEEYLETRSGQKAVNSDTGPEPDDEIYLDSAMLKWLSLAYPLQAAHRDDARQRARNALAALAAIFRTTHHDEMLTDLLAHSSDKHFAVAVLNLSKSVDANLKGVPEIAADAGRYAAELFKRDGDVAGLLRAQLESAYSEHLLLASQQCRRDATLLRDHAIVRKYQWIAIQSMLEASACADTIGDPGTAADLAKQAVALSQQVNYHNLYLRTMATQEWLLSDSGDIPEAWRAAHAGLQKYWAGVFPPMRAYSFYYLTGYMTESLQQWHLFYAFARESVDSIAGTSDYELEAIARHRLAMAAARSGHTDVAREELAKSTALFRRAPLSAITEETVTENTSELVRFEVSSNPVHARELLNEIHASGSAFRSRTVALDYFEAAGQVALREGNLREAQSQFLAAVAIAERIADSLHTEQERLGWSEQSRNAYLGLARTNLAEHRTNAALAVWERHRAIPFLKQPTSPPAGEPLADIGRLASVSSWLSRADQTNVSVVPVHELVLSYAEYPDGIQIWAADNLGVSSAWVKVPADDVNRVARLFNQECSDPTSGIRALQRDGRQLYQWLIAPVEGQLQSAPALVVETDGHFEDVPFSALMASNGKYLGENHSIVLSMDTSFHGSSVLSGGITRDARALVVGAPTVSRMDLPQLPDAESEASNIAEQFRSAVLLTGASATATSVTASLQKTEVFHFAGHAEIAHGAMGLLLSKTGDFREGPAHNLIDGDDLKKIQLHRCKLAVLSACSTARQDDAMPLNRRGLVSSFLYSGVSHVVASEWDVDSGTTARLMKNFYRNLLAGMTVAHALKEVSSGIRRTPATTHPYYWAAFQAFGTP